MILLKTLKKVYKTGYFHNFELKKNYLSFEDCHGTKYVLQPDKGRLGLFILRIGHVEVWTRMAFTYESEYYSTGLVDCAAFIDHYNPVKTDNPDYVLRASLYNLNN